MPVSICRRTGDVTIGINKGGFPAKAVAIPGSTTGLLSYSNPAQVSLIPTDNRFVLFRPDGNGGYVSSLGATVPAVPEPGSLTCFALTALTGAAFGLRRKRSRR